MNKNDQEFLVQKIRTQYTEREHTQLDALKSLDAKVKKPANVFAYIFGSLSAIIMGGGMSLVMSDIGTTLGIANPMIPGVVIGIIGMLMAIINYPVYKKILASRKKKYADKIFKLSEKIMGNHENEKEITTMAGFFKKAFQDMKENAKAQHEVDKANFAAVKAESKANWEEAKAMGDPERRKAVLQAERDEQIAAAKERQAEAQARIDSVNGR